MKSDELKSVYIDRTGDWVRSGNDTGKFYLKEEVDAAIDELKTERHKERDEYISMVHSREQTINELKAQKAQAEDDCVFWKKKYNDCKRELDLLKDTNAFYNGGR